MEGAVQGKVGSSRTVCAPDHIDLAQSRLGDSRTSPPCPRGRKERKIAKVIRGPSVPLPLDHGILNLSNPGAAYQESAGRSSLSNAYVLVGAEKHKRPTFYIRHKSKSLSSRSLLVLSKLSMSFCK
ncbi:UNVERIFIED_CONTAM: hypothetical protein Slati_4540500 [Sesamum latifolium]|uniref:Uncharacterized protein n=1 Tax=Sesamum latifolium TaxID=2727402 RepID=A0AAW2S276_9LAMI